MLSLDTAFALTTSSRLTADRDRSERGLILSRGTQLYGAAISIRYEMASHAGRTAREDPWRGRTQTYARFGPVHFVLG